MSKIIGIDLGTKVENRLLSQMQKVPEQHHLL